MTLGHIVVKGTARKVRKLHHDKVLRGLTGPPRTPSPVRALRGKLEKHQGNLVRAAIELTKDWRTDRVLRKLRSHAAVAERDASLIITGNGDVLEPEHGIIAIGSGGAYAQASAKGLAGQHQNSAPATSEEVNRERGRAVHLHQQHHTIEVLE